MCVPPSFRSALGLRAILIGLIALSITACSETRPTPTPEATAAPGVTPTPSLEPTPTEAIVTLSVWLPESLAPSGTDAGSDVFRDQLADFDARHADARLEVMAKKDGGPGGLLDLLRTASPVAPAALPDVIMLADDDLAIAAREGLIQPLGDGGNAEVSLFAFARNATRIDGKRMGSPLVADFAHLVYDPERFPSPAIEWSDLISASIPFPFALADDIHVSDVVLADYQVLDGMIINAEGQPALNLDALTQLLTVYRDARNAGTIAVTSLDRTNLDAVWSAFRSSNAPLTVIRASRYLAQRAAIPDYKYGRAPAIDGKNAPPIGRTWNLAVVTRDPRRQALAFELIDHLSQTDNVAAWTEARQVLPASADALALWDQSDGYAAFARSELSRALPPPSPAALEAVSPALLNAIRDVLTARVSPQTAATAAVDAVARGIR